MTDWACCGDFTLGRVKLLAIDRIDRPYFKPGDVVVRDGDFTFDTQTVRAIVLVFADELPTRLRERRAEVDA